MYRAAACGRGSGAPRARANDAGVQASRRGGHAGTPYPRAVPTATPLSGRQKRYLRSLAQRLGPVAWVGGEGLAPGVVCAVDAALLTNELVKVRMRDPEDKRALAQALADATGAELAGLVGHTAILYRAHPEAPKIVLPGSPPES
jgi:RNA-binding protein